MQKKILKILLFAALLAYPLKISSQTAELPPVVITEIGAFEPADTEWIEIYNRSGGSADLTDWKFFEDATNHKLAVIRGDVLLEPNEFAVIASKADLFMQKYPEYTGTVFDSSWGSLKEDGEEIGLKDASGNFIELFTYPAAGTNTSLERIDVNIPANDFANWAPHPASHSLGKLREILAPANPEPPSQPQQEPQPEVPAQPQPEAPPEPIIPPPPSPAPPPLNSISSSRVYVPALPKSIASPLSPPSPTPLAPPRSSPIPYPTFHIPEQALFNLRGYFVFIPYNTSAAPPEKKKANKSPPKTAAKKTKATKKTKQKKSAKTASFQNGNLSNLIKITEIFPNPNSEQGEEEWIEIFNGDNRPVNLGNWSLSDASQKSPRPIPDSAIVPPKSYALFPKSETKLSLNNEGDEIFLRDFEGNVADRVSYEQSKPGQSYALVRIEKSGDLVASREWFSARAKSTWEWIDEPTPGKPNPTFSKIEGTVSRLLAGGEAGGEPTFDLTLSNGVSKKIRFTPETLDPLMAEVVLKEGTSVSVQAQKSDGDFYDLKRIDEVRPEPNEIPESPSSEEKKNFSWIIAALIGVGVVLNAIPLIRALLRKFR